MYPRCGLQDPSSAGLDLLLKQWTLFPRTGSSPETRERDDDLSISTDDISLLVIYS